MKTKEDEYMFTNVMMLRKSRRLHTCYYIHMKNIRCLNSLDGYTFNDSSKEKKERNGTRTERQIYIYMYIYLQWNKMNNNNKKKNRNKQETDYNKILVGALTRDRKTN